METLGERDIGATEVAPSNVKSMRDYSRSESHQSLTTIIREIKTDFSSV